MFDAIFPFTNLFVYWWIPLSAAILDALIGDPPTWPHPVRAIGKLLSLVEPAARKLPVSEFAAGCVAVIVVLSVTWAAVRALFLAPFFLAAAFAVYLAFSGLALGQLYREGKSAIRLLEADDVAGARAAIAMLVSRDLTEANLEELRRALAETLAENLNDAFVAPFFWLIVGGPVGLWLYKAASTMDSMWGYPHKPWTRFGTAAARLDDVLAYIPARLTAAFLFVAAIKGNNGAWPENGLGRSSRPGLSRVAEDARKMKSPNAGWPMASCAWICNAAMGGKTVYAGKPVDKPILGPAGVPWTTAKLEGLCKLTANTGVLCVGLLGCIGFALHAVIH